MSLLSKHLALNVALRETIAEIGVRAQKRGKEEAAVRCLKFASIFGDDAQFTVNLKADMLLCSLCDHLRSIGRADLVADVEAIIAALKDGEHRTIIGSVDYGVNTIGELDAQLEAMHRIGEKILPR